MTTTYTNYLRFFPINDDYDDDDDDGNDDYK